MKVKEVRGDGNYFISIIGNSFKSFIDEIVYILLKYFVSINQSIDYHRPHCIDFFDRTIAPKKFLMFPVASTFNN